jgi:hypothetical protein
MAKTNIKPLTPSLAWLTKLLSLYSQSEISIPTTYREQCSVVEELLENDHSGLVNSLLDFGISSALVDYSVETSNKTLTKTLNNWLKNINSALRGQIPVGISALAKEYFRERWKGSSFIILRTLWEQKDGFVLPTKLWLVDGSDIQIADHNEGDTNVVRKIDQEKYELVIRRDYAVPLPKYKNEMIFVQKPYERWSDGYAVPYLIKRGVYYNAKFLELLSTKGSSVVGKALEYLFMMRKGTEELAKLNKPEFIYSDEDLKKVKNDFQSLLNDLRNDGGVPTYTTNFDTELQHLIPEYERILQSGLYAPIERRILAGLGFIEVVEGLTSTRRDAILNPKVFVTEIKNGISDFSMMLTDILMTIIEKNRELHRKYANSAMIQIRTSPIKSFFSDKVLTYLRSLYDRGLLSKRTLVELGADIDFDAEIERRNTEKDEGLDKKMYPPVIQNLEQSEKNKPESEAPGKNPEQTTKEKVPESKKGPEKKNFTFGGIIDS